MFVPLLLIAAVTLSQADSNADVAAAKAHFATGQQLYRKAKYAEALAEFETAYKLKPNGVVLYNIGRCYERLGEIRVAIRNYQEYLRQVPNAPDRVNVQRALAGLEKKMEAEGVQQLLVDVEPPGSVVRVDSAASGPAPFTVDLRPGKHHLRVEHEGFEPMERDFAMSAKSSLQFDIELKPMPVPVVPQRSDLVLVPRETPTQRANATLVLEQRAERTRAYIAGGVAVVAAGVGTWQGLSARAAQAELVRTQHGQADAQNIYNQATQRELVANVAFGAAVVAGGIALWQFLASRSGVPESAPPPGASP